jgi:oxygen-dependent protoporphyrinogen oxidase
MKPVAIIGGGITGLSAAFHLKQKNIPVRVFEAANRVGGVVQSARRDGHLVEFGPNSILETSSVISDLVRDLGLEGRKMYSDPGAENRYIVRGKKPVLMPSSPWSFPGTPLFSASAKLRLLLEPFIPPAPASLEESVAEFVLRRLGQEFLDYAIDPMVAGVYAGNPHLLSVPHAFPKLHALEQRYHSLILGQVFGARERKRRGEVSKQNAKKLSFDEGLQVLIDTLAARLADEIQTSCPVQSAEAKDGGWTVTPATGKPVPCAAVVLAMPAYKMARLKIQTAPPLNLALLGDIYYAPVATIVLGFRRADVGHALDGFGMLVPAKEGFNILGALFSSSLFPNRAPAGEVTLTCYAGGARAPQLPLLPPAELIELAVKDVSAILDIKGRPTFQHLTVFPQAIPQYNVGYGKFRDLMSDMEKKAPGLFVAGTARDGISLGDSIGSGCNVASKIMKFLASAESPPPVAPLVASP